MPSSITLYRFLAAQWALKSLSERRLRVSRIKELNDPFEWRIGAIADTPELAEIGRRAFDAFVERINDKFGIISMSGSCSDPVTWSHYADSHRGIALEFDHLRTPNLHAVTYSHALPAFDVSKFVGEQLDSSYTLSILQSALACKSLSWGYEREHRVHVDLEETPQEEGHYFIPIPEDFLARVILGIRCETPIVDVQAALDAGGFENIPIVRTRMSDTTYEILEDET